MLEFAAGEVGAGGGGPEVGNEGAAVGVVCMIIAGSITIAAARVAGASLQGRTTVVEPRSCGSCSGIDLNPAVSDTR
jgi:hypothetical protein